MKKADFIQKEEKSSTSSRKFVSKWKEIWNDHDNRLLAENEEYFIIGFWEGVYLVRKKTGKYIKIGDIYGNPKGALIDRQGRFAASWGNVLIIYFLDGAFRPYNYRFFSEYVPNSRQWGHYYPEDEKRWIMNVIQKSDSLEMILDDDTMEEIPIDLIFENRPERYYLVYRKKKLEKES